MTTHVNGLDIKIMRLRAGLRQYDLAARLGVHPSRLSEIESGRRQPAPQLLERLLLMLKEDAGSKAHDAESEPLRPHPSTVGATVSVTHGNPAVRVTDTGESNSGQLQT